MTRGMATSLRAHLALHGTVMNGILHKLGAILRVSRFGFCMTAALSVGTQDMVVRWERKLPGLSLEM